MLLRSIGALAASVSLTGAAVAHDLWMDLDRWAAPGEAAKISIEFHVGHARDLEPWNLRPQREVALYSIGPSGRIDQRDALIYPTAGAKSGAALTLEGAGVHLIAFESDNSAIELPSEKFNSYLDEEGLTPAIEHRRREGLESEPGRELYSRRAKALVQIGGAAAAPPPPLGLTLEISPLDDPYALEDRQPLRVRVDYLGKPLEGATISIESLDVGLLSKIKRKTNAEGVAAFVFPHRGAWKFNVVWTRPIKGDARADFETVFSSLTFGYP